MKNVVCTFLLALTGSLFNNCQTGPQPINYGKEPCYFCRMTIVDQQHAAEIVTNKGKIYKFDALECMANAREELGEENIALYLCTTFDKPGMLVDVSTASFLISEALPSPMGANLTAFSTNEALDRARGEFGGTSYTWDALLDYLKSKNYVFHY